MTAPGSAHATPGSAPRAAQSSCRWPARAVAAALLLAVIAGCGAGVMPAIHGEPQRLEEARKAMERHDWTIAIELFKAYASNNAGSKDVDAAIYQLGVCYLKAREPASAQVEFERVLRDYPESDSAGSSSYQLGEALWDQARPADFDQDFTQKALDAWMSYLRGYPGHWRAAQGRHAVEVARTRLARRLIDVGDLYLKLNLASAARVYYRKVLDAYGDTEPAYTAQFGLAMADAKQKRTAEAIKALKELETTAPAGPLRERAARERAALVRQAH